MASHSGKRSKGGAEKLRDKKIKLMETEAKKCAKLTDMFGKILAKHDNACTSEKTEIESEVNLEEVSQCLLGNDLSLILVTENEAKIDSEEALCEKNNENILDKADFSQRPKPSELFSFFKNQCKQPFDISLPFIPEKVFNRANGTNRCWLSYDDIKCALFCTVCVAFRKEKEENSFTVGMNDWRHVYQRILEHESSKMHDRCAESYFLCSNNKDIAHLLCKEQKDKRKEQVRKKRQVLERVVNIVKVLGKRGLSFRGKNFEAAYTLNDPNIDHGNFLEFLILLSKYDIVLKEHFDDVIAKSKKMHEAGKKGRGGLITLISKTTVNLVIDIISNLIKKAVTDEVKQAEMYSVQLDTTQDISVKDQCSIILRYVSQNNIHERLLAVVNCKDSTGKGILELLKNELDLHNLPLKNCIANATDGAANMQGKYNGFATWIKDYSPEQIHVWCYSHILNLVLCDVTKSTINTAALFNLCNSVAVFFKESYKRMDIWNMVSNDSMNRKLQMIGETRWWAKEVALIKIFAHFGSHEKAMYVDLLLTLDSIQMSEKLSPDMHVKALNFMEGFLKYETILTAHMYMRIFKIIGPLSKYLQTSGLDLLKCHEMVITANKELKYIQRDMENVEKCAQSFITWATDSLNLRNENNEIEIQNDFSQKRVKKRKRMDGEVCLDDPIKEERRKFEVETHNRILDTIIESMDNRFKNNGHLYTDLSLLSPTNFDEVQKGLPTNSLITLSEKIVKFNSKATKEKLQNELYNFALNWDGLKRSASDVYLIYQEELSHENVSKELSEEVTEECGEIEICLPKSCQSCQNCALCCFQVLQKYNLFSESYNALTTAYKYLLTLPITQVACERSFSTLKYVKNRLRSTMSDSHLEAFMMMCVEKDMLQNIDCDTVIDKVAEHSNLLKKELFF